MPRRSPFTVACCGTRLPLRGVWRSILRVMRFFVAFPTATGAVAAAAHGQRALASGPIAVRMGLLYGNPDRGR